MKYLIEMSCGCSYEAETTTLPVVFHTAPDANKWLSDNLALVRTEGGPDGYGLRAVWKRQSGWVWQNSPEPPNCDVYYRPECMYTVEEYIDAHFTVIEAMVPEV